MKPQVGQVWLFHATGMDMYFLLIRENKHGSFDLLQLETGRESWLFKSWKTGTRPGEWERFA